MANGHVEIHDPFTNHDGLKSNVFVAANDADDARDDSGMEDTAEFRFLMVYATRRRRERGKENGSVDLNGSTTSPQTPPQTPLNDSDSAVTKKKKKKRRGMKGWKRLLSCIRPRTTDDEPEPKGLDQQGDVTSRCYIHTPDDVEVVDELEEAAALLAELADEIPFVPSDLQTDTPEDDVERLIGLLLREAGDRLNEQELRDVSLAREMFWNYSFFKTLITELFTRMGLRSADPESPGPQTATRTQIAVTCEATSRLTALDTLPMNRLLGYGARFLNEYYSSWVQEQGGYEAAFDDEDEDEVH